MQSDGWAYFVGHAHTEWAGAGFVSRIGTAVGKGEGVSARIVYETHLNILRMLQWPSDRLKELGAEVEE